ncbi:hypothetical protein [Cohnella rhizosphaerae]|uniref:5-bromo-4-chloroindolyl phosphate hydrolysis protein n=1 Tax=Cohnella rhizosphaerae TaxID=1457232 RepID=A0A9X4KTF3_9BACL|nr:hypothetical protein [Cohnella rhizosphaerae]MDG0810754.1 hypothetical protein [Cohnella rhizosphaerae]
MVAKNYLKMLGVVVGAALVNIIALSPAFAGLTIGGGAFETALGVTLLAASAIAIIYGSYNWLYRSSIVLAASKPIKTREDYASALAQYGKVRALAEDIALALEQMDRMDKKKATLLKVLHQRFDPAEMSFSKFSGVAEEVENLFYLNIKSVLNRLGVFDEAEYERVMTRKSARYSPKLLQEKTDFYNEYMSYIKHAIGTNEEMLLQLDKLLLEISRLDSIEPGDIERMPAMVEIDSLIKQTKYYKQ